MKTTRRVTGIVLVIVMLAACLPLVKTEVSAARSDGYLTLTEAAQQIKQHMLDRNTAGLDLKVYVEDPRPLGDMQIREMFDDIVFRHTGAPTEGDYLFYSTTGTSYYVTEHNQEGNTHWITLMFTASYFQSAVREAAVTARVQEILSSLSLNGKSDYEKIHAIYSYICANVDYDLDYEQLVSGTQEYNDIYSAYGAIVNNKAVCEGYALAMYRLLLEAGIDNRVIAAGQHAWNVVKLDNRYYYLDSTWDYDYTPENFNWFLKGSADFLDVEHMGWLDAKEYPVSPISYGAPATATGSGSCGDSAAWTLTADGTLSISGSGAMKNTTAYETLWPGLNMYIKKVVIQEGITSIGDYAFWNCPQLSSVSIASSVNSIGEYAFDCCIGLEEITIPNTVTTIGAGAFNACTALEKVVLPSGLTEIARETFNSCRSLKSITIPQSVKVIGTCAFSSAFAPDSNYALTLSENVTSVGWRAFGWAGIKSAVWNAKTELLDTDMFYMCEQLETVVLSDSIKRFGTEVFSHCYRLRSVKMPSGLVEMEDFFQGVFLNCYALESITIPETLTKINTGIFQGCISLKEILLHEGITEIGNVAFSDTGIRSIVIPKSVKRIGIWAFRSKALESITFQGDAPQFHEEGTFGSFGHTITVYYPGANGTWNSDNLNRISVGANVDPIGVHGANDPHTLGSTWYSDGSSHWKQCTGCDHKDQISAHSYTNSCDETCDVCGYFRSVLHAYEWGYNADQHWCVCKCGASLVSPEAHKYVNGFCTDCGAKEENASGGTVPTVPPVTEPNVTEPIVTEPTVTDPGTSEPVGSEPASPGTSGPGTPNATEPSTPSATEPSTPAASEPVPTAPADPLAKTPWLLISIVAVVIVGGVAAFLIIETKKSR